MDGLKSDSETELTSTMGNALSVTNKDEKNDTNDATPTSSTDASTASTSSRIVSDDPISSTSSDTVEQTKATEMSQSVTDLLEMNIPSEKITEDVEDLVHDLESLLGESTDSFSIPSRTPPEERKEAEDVVSQTSGELNEEQEEQIPVTCDADHHSKDSARTLETRLICDVSAEEEKLDLGGSTSKTDTDITSSKSCLQIEEGDDANDLHQTTSNTDSPLEQEIEPTQGVQEKRDIDTDGGTSSKIFDEPQVVLDSGDVEVEDIKTEQEVIDKSEEHVTDTGDHVASEPKSDTNQEVECEKDVSSQTGIEKNDLSGRTESPQEVEGNTVALDEGAADQDIIITSDSDRPDDSIQKSKTDILDKTTTEVPADSNIANSEDLRDKVDDMTSQNIQEITGESEPPADPPGSCLALEVQQSVDDVQDNIEGTDKGVIGSSEEKSENQPELQKDSEEIENETVIGTNEQIESEISNVTVSRIPEIIVSEISEDTVSGSNEETAVSTEDNVLTTDEASSDIKQTSSQEISGDIELSASSPTECTENDNPVEATFAVKNDDVYEEDAEEMSEMIPTHSEISQTVDTSNSEAMNPTEVEGDNPQCATASSSSEVTAIGHHAVVEDNLQSEKIDNEPISDVEGCLIESTVTDCENVRDTQKEDKTKSDHLEETHNQPSVCEQQLDIMEVPNVESLEAVISEQNVPDITESYDMKECADEPLEGISTNPADEEEETVIGRETDKFLCEENRTAIKDGENEKCLENSDDCALSPTQTNAEFVLVDPSRSDIPINDTIESHKTVDNVEQIDYIGDIPAEEKEEKDLRNEEENTEKIEEQSTNVLKNEDDMNVEEEDVACRVISDTTDPSVTDKLAEEMKLKTDDSLDESYIQDVECSQSYGSVMEKTNSNIQQLAESSGIVEELENDNRVEHTSNEDSIPLPTKMDATSTIDGNEIEETKDSKGEKKSEISPTEDIEKATEEMLNECTEETLTQPDSTQGIDKIMDDDKKSAVDSPEVVENDEEVKASEFSEASLDNQSMGDVLVATETVSDDESSPAQSDKPSAVLIDSSEDNSNVTGSESKPSKITQLEFAPLVLSEEDSEEEAAPNLRLDENDSEVLENIKDSQPLPQLDDIIASQPVIVESTAPVDNVDMQENLETILAVASLQKIDIPRETESEQVLSETERREMEALRRAVESITDNSASVYVEEAEALVVESDACDADASSEQAELMEAIPTEDSVNQVETESVPKVQEGDEIDNIVQDNTSYRSDVEKHEETTEKKLPDSSEPVEYGREQDVMVNKEDTNLETDTVETFEPKSQELETHVDEVASSGENDKPEINLKTMADSSVVSNEAAGNSEEGEPDISTSESAEVAVASEKNTVCQTDDQNLQSTSEDTDAPIATKEEMPSGPIADDTIVQNVPPEEKTLENDENSEEPNEMSPEGDENDATVSFSDAGESQGVEAATEENQQEVIEIIPQPTESNEQKDSQQMIENDSTKADLTVESRESGASEKLDERNTTEIYTEATQEREDHQKIYEGDNKSQERESAQVVDEYNTEINSEIGGLQQGEVLQKVNEQESTEPDGEPSESQERVTVRNVNQQENVETDTEEREAAQTVDEERSAETVVDLVESQKSEATEEVKDQDRKTNREEVVRESTETDPEVGGSQEREATQKLDQRKVPQRRTGLRNTLPEQETLIDSSQVTVENEAHPAPVKEKEVKVKTNERPKRHKKADNKLEELSINVDVPDREKPYSPKITIKPIKVPDEEVSTTSNSEAEVTKGSLKMTITKQSDKLHSVLKVCDSENPESTTDVEEPIPKLKIKPKMQQLEQQHSPKMSTRSSNQRSLSPRITIKPVVKPDKQEALSPLKIKIGLKSEETPKKHSSKANSRSASKQEDDTPRKVLIKPVVKPAEESESAVSPRITIKLPKPEVEKDAISPRMNIKAIRKQDEENDEKERSSPKITIKPVVKPHEPDSHPEEGEEVKERIVLKINKGNLPTPTKESKKREHPPDDEKSEKLAKITVKFSKEGGHPHIVQQMEESHKRSHEEPSVPEKNKKQKVEAESTMSTRSRHKEVSHDAPVETKPRHKEHAEGSDSKSKLKDTDTPQFESSRSSKHKDHSQQESPIEPKRTKLKDPLSDFPGRQSRRSSSRSRQREVDAAVADDVQIVEQKLNSPIVISEDSRSQDSASVILVEDSKEEATMNLTPRSVGSDSPRGTPKSDSVASTPSTTPTPRKRGRPRKVPIEVREEFKEQDEPPVKTKPKQQLQVQQQEEGEASAPQQQQQQQSAPSSSQETGRPKRSCRGPSVCDRLGIKPRQPRGGPGRGRGGKRGVGTRPTPMKPEKVPKLTKAKLKLLQKAAQDEAEAIKAFGNNPPVIIHDAGSSEDVIIIEDDDLRAPTPEAKKKHKSEIDAAATEGKTAQGPDTKRKSKAKLDVSATEIKGTTPETKRRYKSKADKKLAEQTPVDHLLEAQPSGNDSHITKELLSDPSNSEKAPDEAELQQKACTETNIETEQSSSVTEIEQESTVTEASFSVVESSESVPADEPVIEETIVDEKLDSSTLETKRELLEENVAFPDGKKELLAPEDISLEVKTELISSNETSDRVDVSLTAGDNNISLEDVSFKLDDKDIEVEATSDELCKEGADVAVDVEDEIPYSVLAPPGSSSSKVFPSLAQGMPSSVQPLLPTSQKSTNAEHSSVSSTSEPSEIVMVDEETRMSADTSSRAQTPAKQMVAPADMTIEESQSSVHSSATTESGKTPSSSRPSKAPRLEVQESDNNVVTAELISEYYWNGNGPFMIQEQVAQFLGIKSFKRKYPGIARRMVEMQERDFIREKGLASENMCDLGLTVVNSADILDIMYSDFQEKYEEYCKHQRDRQAKEMIDKQRAMNLAASQEKNKANILEQAVQSAAQWNARFNKTRKDQRKTCMDLQTLTVHYPKGRMKQINKATTGNYPVALVPGQFTDFYEEFTPTEINNLPLNTICYDPVTFIPREESEESGSEGSESDSDSSESSSSGSNSDSSSGIEDCKMCKHSPKRVVTPK